jgi:hypothetical protein
LEKITQTSEKLLSQLSSLDTDWKDDVANKTIDYLDYLQKENIPSDKIIRELLEKDFDVASLIFRLFLELSKDEYEQKLAQIFLGNLTHGKSCFKSDPDGYVQTLNHLMIREAIIKTVDNTYTWKDIIIERLKAGRGSAIKGQKRGRQLEDFVENIVREVFPKYEARCSFTGLNGISTEKADFAIPTKEHPDILIEVKGYGATGSKQTDVIGDVNRIIQEKRHDTTLLIFTDGITWNQRESDFKKLVQFQNHGYIYKIYTKKMMKELLFDLQQLKSEKNL